MESTELKAEGEALRRTLERIEFLLKQGFITEEDAVCRKQGAMDNFCLAPMIDRRQQLQTEIDRVSCRAGGNSVDLASGGNISSLPAAAAAAAGDTGLSAVDSDPPTCSLSSGSTSEAASEVLGRSGHVPSGRASPSITESTASCDNPDAKKSKRRRLTEVSVRVSRDKEAERWHDILYCIL